MSIKQAVIKLIEKRGKINDLFKVSKSFKVALFSLISSNQTAYLNNRFISEGGRLISDILEANNFLKLKGLLLTIDIEKALDSINDNFLLKVLEKLWLLSKSILLQHQESCVINGGKTMRYLPFKRGTQQGDPILSYLFILVLEIAFIFVKVSESVQGLSIFNNQFLYTTYTDDTSSFLSNKNSVT